MHLPSSDPRLHRLAAAARQAALPADPQPPLGFATRVLAQLRTESAALLLERLGWRSLAAAAVLCAVCLGRDLLTAPAAEDDWLATEISSDAFQP